MIGSLNGVQLTLSDAGRMKMTLANRDGSIVYTIYIYITDEEGVGRG